MERFLISFPVHLATEYVSDESIIVSCLFAKWNQSLSIKPI